MPLDRHRIWLRGGGHAGPFYIFATYVDCREEWAIRADNLEHARKLIGGETNGAWRKDAVHLDTEPVEARELVLNFDDEPPLIEEITPDHWAWREAHRDATERSLKQNIAAISGDFHTRRLCNAFHEAFGDCRRVVRHQARRRPLAAQHGGRRGADP